MRIAIITGVPVGGAGAGLRELLTRPGVEVAYVIVAAGGPATSRWKRLRRKVLKTWRIGLLGALNGIRMRKWFTHSEELDVRDVAAQAGVRVEHVLGVNDPRTAHILAADPIDLGVSLGNGYIEERVFSIPKHGMINYHGELLPEYPGALSIVWPIYFGLSRTGFTIHRIDRGIDTGDILMRREFEIVFEKSLKDTIRSTGKLIHPNMPVAIADVVSNWDAMVETAQRQRVNRRFTTPTFRQYLQMVANNRRLWRAAREVSRLLPVADATKPRPSA